MGRQMKNLKWECVHHAYSEGTRDKTVYASLGNAMNAIEFLPIHPQKPTKSVIYCLLQIV